VDHADQQIFGRFRFSALASQPLFIPRPPIYAGVERTSVSHGHRMATSGLEKLTVIQTHGLAYSRTETNPFSGIGGRSSSQSAAHISPEYKPKKIPSMQFKRQGRQWIGSRWPAADACRDGMLAFAR